MSIVNDYENSILGIPNSILKHFGAKTHHATLPVLDERLSRGYKNVVLLVLDGMGLVILKAHAPDGFLMRNYVSPLNSLYPCTTSSMLTTFETGLTPIEHGWLGWSLYFEEIGKCVDVFSGNESGTNRPAAERNIVTESIGYNNLFTQIREVNRTIECCSVSPFGDYRCNTNESICNQIETLCKTGGRRYIYAYYSQPDMDMHFSGCYSERAKADMVLFEKQIEQLSEQLTDTILIVTADHGMIDIKSLLIEDYPDIGECLAVRPTREPRCLSFFVKPEFKEIFPERWNAQFGNDFLLMTGTEAYDKGVFGKGTPHKYAKSYLGDYVAIAIGNLALWYRFENGKTLKFKAGHAGLTPDEMIVPLIIVER